MTTQSSEIKKIKEERLTILRDLLRQRRERENTMKEIKLPQTKEESTTKDAELMPSLGELLKTCDLVGSESMKVLDESVLHLQSTMLSSVTPFEACLCANTMAKMIRLKFDIRRQARG